MLKPRVNEHIKTHEDKELLGLVALYKDHSLNNTLDSC